MKNIVLTGFMGTGKSTVGKELARRLGMTLIELDSEIEKAEGMTIREIFSQYGEEYFRQKETEAIKRLSGERGLVISTGGGVVLREENMDILRRDGVVICLWAEPETVLERTSDTRERPLLDVEDPLERIRKLLEYRRPFYEQADHFIKTDGKTPVQIAEEIIELTGED